MAKGMLFLNNVNPFTKFFKNVNCRSNSILFKKHGNFSFNLKLNFRHTAESLTDCQTILITNLYKERDFRYIEFDKLNNLYYNEYLFLNNNENLYYETILDKILLKYGSFMSRYYHKKNHHTNYNNSIININFLRKERLYTKLKYSRSPAYDIVSGGSAALLAAFLGFLISEKYGFELVDSGDFYYLFMYAVFVSFSLKPLAHTMNHVESWFSIVSVKPFLSFSTMIANLFTKSFK